VSATVTKRLVFYCPGYDPDAETRYRRLFVTGFAQTARRFGIVREIGSVERDEAVPAQRWSVTASKGEWRTETAYEMLCWHDLVERDLQRSWFYRMPLLIAALAEALHDGVIPKIYRIDWQFGLMMLYPWVALLALFAASFGAAYGLVALLALAVPLAFAAKLALALPVAIGLLSAADRTVRRAFIYLMLDAWVFNWQHATGRRPDFEERLDRFCDRVAAAIRSTNAQEVLIVGHSTGSVMAAQLAARVLAHAPDLGEGGPALCLMTIGGELPLSAIVRKAEPLRRDIARLATTPLLLWVDYQAPQDPLNAAGFDPVRDLSLDLGDRPQLNPVIRSPRFKDLLSPATYRRIRYNFFRLHFQFLMANEVAGEYDYFTITCGPVRLRDRIADPAAALRTIYGPEWPLPDYLTEAEQTRPVAAEPQTA
jgi:pimeloyl-ACP methyl ester carboxylesterase